MKCSLFAHVGRLTRDQTHRESYEQFVHPSRAPEEFVERPLRYKALGRDEFALWLDSGMSFEHERASLERFITRVMPAS